jgi:integrase
VGVLSINPLGDVSPPPAADPRCHFLEMPDALRVVEGAAQPFSAIYALAYGAGLEVSAILRLVDADVDPQARQVRARGTKTWTRDRLARVADWAWPFVQERLATVLPGERVFRGLDRWRSGRRTASGFAPSGSRATGCTTRGTTGRSGWRGPAPRSN